MGIVYHDQTFDDEYSKEIISRVRELSPELDEWIVTEKYLLETEQDNVTSLWLRNRLLCKTVDQLSARGIFINQETDDLLDSPLMIEVILTLRAKFDQDKLYTFLVKRQDLRDQLGELIDDDCIDDIIQACHLALPIDEGWESLYNLTQDRPGILRTTSVFNEMLETVFARCERLGDVPAVDDDGMDKLLSYMKFLADRKNRIAAIASTIYAADNNGALVEEKKLVILEYMKTFERELSNPRAIRDYLDGEFLPKGFVEKRRSFYVSKWNHCLEYWCTQEHREDFPNELNMAILIATLYVDAPDPTHARVYVIEQFENQVDLLGSKYDAFREAFDRALGNIIVYEGGMNNAIV